MDPCPAGHPDRGVLARRGEAVNLALQGYYETNRVKFADAPPFSRDPAFLRYAACTGRAVEPGTTWAAFLAVVGEEDGRNLAMVDPRLPLWNEDGHGWCGLVAPEDAREELTRLCAEVVIPEVNAYNIRPPLLRLLSHAPHWYSTPRYLTDKNEDFTFYRMHCLLAGAGKYNWPALAAACGDIFAGCPFTEEPNPKELLQAHQTSGWPTAMVWLDWSEIPDWQGESEEWLTALAMLHLFKHCRREGDELHIVYRGRIDVIPRPKGSACLGQWDKQYKALANVLGVPGKGSAKCSAMGWALARVAFHDLLHREPLATLPGCLLHGPWSSYTAAAKGGGFYRADVRLEGVWKAANGRVSPYGGSAEEILGHTWNVLETNTPATASSRKTYEACLPATYVATYPSAILKGLFPNWALPDGPEGVAYESLLDAIFVAGILRPRTPELLEEFPFVAILPLDPKTATTTNQGKGAMTKAIATAFQAGTKVLTVPDSTSAPDSRTVAHAIRTTGFVALDEFQIPTSRGHVLCSASFQSLCTGGLVGSGQVYADHGEVSLKQSIVLNAKWLDLADDLVTRCVPLYLDILPDAQRAEVEMKAAIDSGRMGILLRLAAVSMAEVLNLDVGRLPATADSWRFPRHRNIAVALMVRRLGCSPVDAANLLDATLIQIRDDLRRHQQLADESGVSATTASGHNLRIAWAPLWSGVDDISMTNLVSAIGINPAAIHKEGLTFLSCAQVLAARLHAAGIPGNRFSHLIGMTMGAELRATNTAVAMALATSARAFFRDQIAAAAPQWVSMPGDMAPRWVVCCRLRGGSSDAKGLEPVFSFKRRDE